MRTRAAQALWFDLGIVLLLLGALLLLAAMARGQTPVTGAGGGGAAVTGPDTPPAVADPMDDEFSGTTVDPKWAWVNQSGSAATVSDGSLVLASTTTGNQWSLLLQSAPAGTWTIQAKVALQGRRDDFHTFGLCVMDSASGHRIAFGVFANNTNGQAGGIELWKYNSISEFASAVYADHSGMPSGFIYFRIAKDATNLTYSYSYDGMIFTTVAAEAMATFVAAPDKIGFGIWSTAAGGQSFNGVASWFRRIN